MNTDLYFPQVHGLLPGVIFTLHAFYGHILARVLAMAEDHRSVGAIPQLIQCHISIHVVIESWPDSPVNHIRQEFNF